MDKNNLKIGFIGVGLMGYGMALNLINNNFDLAIVAHKKREQVDKLVAKGAKEVENIKVLAKSCNIIIMCVTNTPIAKEIVDKIIPFLEKIVLTKQDLDSLERNMEMVVAHLITKGKND